MNKSGNGRGILILIVIILVVLLVWGFIGGQEAQKIGVTCDTGLGDSLCWKWHTNALGQFQEGVEDFFGNSGS